MTKKEFKNLKVGDKVLIKKHKNDAVWVAGMDKYNNQICTIKRILPNHPETPFLYINEDDTGMVFGFAFSYKSIAKKVDEVDKILNNKPKTLPDFETSKETGSQINDVIKGLMAGGLSREEAFDLVKITCGELMKKTDFKLY